ncbi:MAG: hypothetical protein CFH34_01264 [Alphaproteobacteria bacterium MarineAlpha9_Bin4]|nr:rod-binding protein [Pelagibacterales bacterium]PPR25810.1 MAG: hypothetical protein CFH34_01264 [Alphaproteobacteria bacterium MarineAlpha9_Bin4]
MEGIANLTKKYDLNLLLNGNKDKVKDIDKDLKEVAEEFESLFLNEILKRANSAKLAKSILSNDEQETYTSLLNQERAKAIAKSQSFGIAEALVNQFSSQSKKLNKSSNKIITEK